MGNKKINLKEEINKTIDLINSDEDELSNIGINIFDLNNTYSRFYRFATEDMRGYYKGFGSPKTFLTVGASGDQILNAVKIGAEKIDVFDLNILSKRQNALKVGAASILKPNDIYEYFHLFDEDVFKNISSFLREEDRIYWDSLYDYVGKEEFYNLYPYSTLDKYIIFQINPYLDEEGYEDFQKRLRDVEINYFDADLYSLPEVLGDNRYDAMNFSNVYEYLNYGRNTNKENALKYYNFIMREMFPKLNDNGSIMVSYLYAFSDRVKKYLKEAEENGSLQDIVYSGSINFEQLNLYMKGLTSQNYSYLLLLDLFENENIQKIDTAHIEFGQSFDKSHDMAVFLKK